MAIKKLIQFLFFLILLSSVSNAKIIRVPADVVTIQGAIDIAESGDSVIVCWGKYFENIKFRGKSITVASRFILDHDPKHITKTIINGSKYINPDSASCVAFHGEDSLALLQGFTLTRGGGTVFHMGDLELTNNFTGTTTVEGGGVFFNRSKAVIKNNLIIDNQTIGTSGYDYNGGGGISSFCGNPQIYNNIVINNRAVNANGTTGYASGIVFNESYGIAKNNIIYHNTTSVIGAVFFDLDKGVIFENNTVVGNITLAGNGNGGIISEKNSVIRNNIVWGNVKNNNNSQIGRLTDTELEYCFVETEMSNYENMYSVYPEFTASGFKLEPNSPCIDAGKPDFLFNDQEEQLNSSSAKFPSLGSLRNDIGAYGGPLADIFPDFYYEDLIVPSKAGIFGLVINQKSEKEIELLNLSTTNASVDSVKFFGESTISLVKGLTSTIKPMETKTITIDLVPKQAGRIADTVKIYHNLATVPNPAVVIVVGTVAEVTDIEDESLTNPPLEFELKQNYPNPFNYNQFCHTTK